MYRFILWVTAFMALAAHAEKKHSDNPLTVSLVAYETTSNGTILKKPFAISDSDWLWQLLSQTKIENDLGAETLELYANTIKNLCSANPSILEKDEYHKLSPQDFSLTYCAPAIDKVFEELASIEKSERVDNRTIDQRLKDAARIQTEAGLIADNIKKYAPKSFFTHEEFNNTIVTFNTHFGAKEDEEYTWVCKFKNKPEDKRALKFEVIDKNQNRIGYLHATIEFIKWETKIEIEWHHVAPEKRYHGLGTMLLEAAINLFVEFKSFTKVTYIATPEKMSLAPALVTYYKKHGFVPSHRGFYGLMLYISKQGHIIEPATVASHKNLRKMIKGESLFKKKNPLKIQIPKKSNEQFTGQNVTSLFSKVIASFFTPQTPIYLQDDKQKGSVSSEKLEKPLTPGTFILKDERPQLKKQNRIPSSPLHHTLSCEIVEQKERLTKSVYN